MILIKFGLNFDEKGEFIDFLIIVFENKEDIIRVIIFCLEKLIY